MSLPALKTPPDKHLTAMSQLRSLKSWGEKQDEGGEMRLACHGSKAKSSNEFSAAHRLLMSSKKISKANLRF